MVRHNGLRPRLGRQSFKQHQQRDSEFRKRLFSDGHEIGERVGAEMAVPQLCKLQQLRSLVRNLVDMRTDTVNWGTLAGFGDEDKRQKNI